MQHADHQRIANSSSSQRSTQIAAKIKQINEISASAGFSLGNSSQMVSVIRMKD